MGSPASRGGRALAFTIRGTSLGRPWNKDYNKSILLYKDIEKELGLGSRV